jgi:hypothetical protein
LSGWENSWKSGGHEAGKSGEFMKKQLLLSVLFAFAIRTSGQSQVQPVVITSDYYAGPKVLVLHALNNSGKDIVSYTIVIGHKKADGTIDRQGGLTESTMDMLSALIAAQMAKDPAASENIRAQNAGMEAMPAGYGIFKAGETRDMTLPGVDSSSEFDSAVGVVFYVDGSFDKQDEESFKRMLAGRQHQLQQMKDENELIRSALADSANEHPVAGVLTELNKRRIEEMNKPNRFPMNLSDSELRSMQQPAAYGPMKGKTERERLTQYVEEQDKRIELMTPHCHLEIDLKK